VHVRLVITLKQSIRRCLYRRWEGEVVGREVRTKTVDLERMYRGNTPYPTGKIRISTKIYPAPVDAIKALAEMIARRRNVGYKSS
jgi:hypothetical protein